MSEKRIKTTRAPSAALPPKLRVAIARGNEERRERLRRQAEETERATAANRARCAVWVNLELPKLVEQATRHGERTVTLAFMATAASYKFNGLPADPDNPALLALLRAVPGLTVERDVIDRQERTLRLSWPNPELTA